MSDKIAMIAKLTLQPGKRDEAVNALKLVTDAVPDEAGTEVYTLLLDPKDDDTIWFFELYTDKDGLDAHGKSEAMAAAIGGFGHLLAGAPELTRLSPQTAKGFSL
jgi:quinol monooxygenase YgiN